VVDEVLTADECRHYIDQAERVGLASLETVFPQAYRSSDRLLTLAPPHVVRGLFARLLPALNRRGTPSAHVKRCVSAQMTLIMSMVVVVV
jgi:phosphoribosylaminoimidazole-succinocarboxamide synthase